jgi:hypothetical protein
MTPDDLARLEALDRTEGGMTRQRITNIIGCGAGRDRRVGPARWPRRGTGRWTMNVNALLAAAIHEADPFMQTGHGGTHRGIGTDECPLQRHHHHDSRCDPAAMLLATPSGTTLVARVTALEAVAVKASHMGGCSQTHHDYVIAAARAALEGQK